MIEKKRIFLVYAGRCRTSDKKIGYAYLRVVKVKVEHIGEHFLDAHTTEDEDVVFSRKVVKCGVGNLISCIDNGEGNWGDFKWEGLPDDKALMGRASQMSDIFEHQEKRNRERAKKAPSVMDEIVKTLDENGYFDLNDNARMFWMSALQEKINAEEQKRWRQEYIKKKSINK